MVLDSKRDVADKLSSIQKSIEEAIRYENINMLKDFGANEQTDVNFFFEIERNSLGRRSKRTAVNDRN